MKSIKINTTPSYNVYIEENLLDKVGEMINKMGCYGKVAIITDSAVQKLYLQQVLDSFSGYDCKVVSYAFPNGESSKNLVELGKIYDFLAESEITRTDLVVALGGGVCGDMVGFASSSFLRGVDFVNIPTTLLSMVDSAIGGKTAVNISAGKNQVGAFYQPKMVLCDTKTLNTLSEELIADGVGEIAKYAVLEDKNLFDLLESDNFFERIDEVIQICVKIKDEYVSGDVFDKGKRQLLNLGHTLGHVVEKDSKFAIAHGKAVLIGLNYIAEKFAGTKEIENILLHLKKVAQKFDMPITYKLSADELWKMAVNDKKRHGNYIAIARPYAVGDCRLENVKITNPINYTEIVKKACYDVEISPQKLNGKINPPPSKSHLHRLLICSAFSGEKITIDNVCYSDDILATINALESLGARITKQEKSVIINGIELKKSCVIDCKECGSTFRFFIPICGMLGIKTQFLGSKRLGERGYQDIIDAMESQINFDKKQGLPLNIDGKFNKEDIYISGSLSSQFVSGLMLGAFASGKKLNIHLTSKLSSSGYVDMTIKVIKQFGGEVLIVEDGYSIVPKLKADNFLKTGNEQLKVQEKHISAEVDYSNLAFWLVAGVNFDLEEDDSKQADKIILKLVQNLKNNKPLDISVDKTPDLAPILAVLGTRLSGKSVLSDCARLKAKECDRLQATFEVLNKLGINAEIVGDSLEVWGGDIHGGITLDSYGDHRMAMMETILASFAQNKIIIKNAQVVNKSYPNFWEDYIALGGKVNVINIR